MDHRNYTGGSRTCSAWPSILYSVGSISFQHPVDPGSRDSQLLRDLCRAFASFF